MPSSKAHTSQFLSLSRFLREAGAGTHVVVTTLGPSHHQAWVQHVTFPFLLLRTPVDMGAPTVDPSPIQGDGGVNGYGIGFQGPGLGALTLDLPALGIPGRGEKTVSKTGEELGMQSFSVRWGRAKDQFRDLRKTKRGGRLLVSQTKAKS